MEKVWGRLFDEDDHPTLRLAYPSAAVNECVERLRTSKIIFPISLNSSFSTVLPSY